MTKFPIDSIMLMKFRAIPGLIAELSYQDESKAIEYLRIWGKGECRLPKFTMNS